MSSVMRQQLKRVLGSLAPNRGTRSVGCRGLEKMGDQPPTKWAARSPRVDVVVVQANDRHAYDWERCLEQCRNLLTNVEESFSSVSSSAICHELELVEQGAQLLSGSSLISYSTLSSFIG